MRRGGRWEVLSCVVVVAIPIAGTPVIGPHSIDFTSEWRVRTTRLETSRLAPPVWDIYRSKIYRFTGRRRRCGAGGACQPEGNSSWRSDQHPPSEPTTAFENSMTYLFATRTFSPPSLTPQSSSHPATDSRRDGNHSYGQPTKHQVATKDFPNTSSRYPSITNTEYSVCRGLARQAPAFAWDVRVDHVMP
jgi:hypothetical protein